MPKKGPQPPSSPALASWAQEQSPALARDLGVLAVVSPVPVSLFARTPRFNLSEMPRHHAVYSGIGFYQVVPGDPNVHPALREDAAREAVAAAARAVRKGERTGEEGGRKDGSGNRDDRNHRDLRIKTERHYQTVEDLEENSLMVRLAGQPRAQEGDHNEESERPSRRKEKGDMDILSLKPYLKENLDNLKSRVDTEPLDKQRGSTSHVRQRQQQRNYEDSQEIGSGALVVPTSQHMAAASIIPERPRQHKHHNRSNENTVPSRTKQAHQATKQTHTQKPTYVDLSPVSNSCPPTASPASIPKPFPIHILLRRITTSNNLSPRQKSSLLKTLHGSLVDISIRTSLDIELAQHYAKITGQVAAVQDLVAEIEDPTPGKSVSLESLKASGALGGYLFGTPGLNWHVRNRSGSESSSVYSQDGMSEASEWGE